MSLPSQGQQATPLPAYSLEGKGLTQHHGIQFTTAGVWHGTGFCGHLGYSGELHLFFLILCLWAFLACKVT